MSIPAWPPIIRGDRVPRWVRARDLALTIAAWALLAYFMRGALLLIGDWLSYPYFELNTVAAPDWPRIWSMLAPFAAVAAVLAAWLVFWVAQRRAILMRQQAVRQPEPLDLAAHAQRFGLSVQDVLAARAVRVLTVRFEADGSIAPLTSA